MVRKYCDVGCIGCKICEKKSPEGGYTVEKFLSRIDYSAAGDRKAGSAFCPTKCIIQIDTKQPVPKEEIVVEKKDGQESNGKT